MEPDPSFWGKALEQLPALVISLVAFIFIFVRGMMFFNNLTVTFMRHQEERDKSFLTGMSEMGQDCHRWAEQREERLLTELEACRTQAGETSTVLGRVASALERP